MSAELTKTLGKRENTKLTKEFPCQNKLPSFLKSLHEIAILKLLRGLQLRLSGVFRINSHYRYSFLVFFKQNAVTENKCSQGF